MQIVSFTTSVTTSDSFALSLSSTIGARQIVTVSYAVPTTGTVIEDLAGNKAKAFDDFPVTNNSTVANTTPPVPASGTVPASGASLTLTFNEDLDIAADTPPPPGQRLHRQGRRRRGDGGVRGARHRSGPLRPESAR